MLSSEVELVDSAWGNIGMSRPEYLAWKRIKKFLAEVQSSSHSGESAPCEEELCPECKVAICQTNVQSAECGFSTVHVSQTVAQNFTSFEFVVFWQESVRVLLTKRKRIK